jgi:hypothetical protein
MNRRSKLVVAAGVSVILTVFVLRAVDSSSLLTTLYGVRFGWVAMAAVAFMLFQVLKWARLVKLIGHNPPGLFMLQTQQALFNALFPAGFNDLLFAYLLKRGGVVSIHGGVAAVVLARVADIVAFVIGIALIIAFTWSSMPDGGAWVLAGLVMILVCGVIALLFGHRLTRWSGYPLGRVGLALNGLIARHLVPVLEEVSAAGGWRSWVVLIGLSGLMWTVMYGFFVATVFALSDQITARSVLWLFILLFPADLLPIRGLANFGTHEAAWFVILNLLGVSREQAANLAISSHLLMLAVILATVLPATAWLIFRAMAGAAPGIAGHRG